MRGRLHPALEARRRAVSAERMLRRRSVLLGARCAVAGLAAMWWVLTGPVLAVRSVEVSDYSGPNRAALEATLDQVAPRGTILAPPAEDLRIVARHFPDVEDVVVERKLPLGVRVRVIEARPAAVAVPKPEGAPMAVTDDGRVLGPPRAGSKGLPRVWTGSEPAIGERLQGDALLALRFATTIEPDVAARLRSLRVEDGRLLGKLARGPRLLLGDTRRLPAKARSLTAVLNHLPVEEERAATYLDVSVPEAPALGGLVPVEPSSET
ncbi:MAG: cell division protein FtsQ/DivIB [Miltoncostaeaceae bacterium]